MMMYHQTKFGCQRISSSEDIVAIVIFWLYKLSLWPWHWRQCTNFSTWHSGSWCYITIPSLVTKWSVAQKISSRQTFTNILNLCCDVDLERSSPIFCPQNTPASDDVLTNQVWLQTDQQFRTYSKKYSYFDYISPRYDFDIQDSEPIFLHDTSPHGNTQLYQVW